MGKEGELWDDSALLNAFDDAMSKYKKMHAKKTKDDSTDGEPVCPTAAQEICGAVSDAEEKQKNATLNSLTSSGEAKILHPDQEDHREPCVDSSSGQHKLGVNGNSYSQNLDGYNQLLNQYYELEEKRQMILNQLQQFGGYDYQTSAEGFGSSQQWGTCYTSHNQSFPTSQPYATIVGCSCCPYDSHCSAAPCISFPCSKMCDNSCALTCHAKSPPLTDGDIVKTAMAAAEKAITSIKSIESTQSSTEGKGKDNADQIAQSMSSETDLSLVLNAWYSAGFYTGRYLTEQSKKGK